MFTFFNTCNQCICRDSNGNIRVNNGWNGWNGWNSCNGCGSWNTWNGCNGCGSWNAWNRCNSCNGCSCNGFADTATNSVNTTSNGSSDNTYGCVRVCGYNLTSRNLDRSSGCSASRNRRSSCGCGCND